MHLLQCFGRPCGLWTSLSSAPTQGQHFCWGLAVVGFLTTVQVASDVVYPQIREIAKHTVPAGGLRRSQSTAGKLYKRNMEPTLSSDMEGLSQSQWTGSPTASPEALMIEVGRLKLMPPRGDDTAMNQIPPTSTTTCIEESIAENGKVLLIPSKLRKWSETLCRPSPWT